jgi:ABC-2 type transport system ATP-binding protein
MSADAAPEPVPAVRIDGLSHRFGDHLAVDNLDLTVSPGECFGLLGPNGAGKTTTLRVLNTLYPPQSGTVRVFGLDVRSDAMSVRRMLGYSPSSCRSRER